MADFTIADVLAWARTKPAGETYRYTDGCGGCALCQFLIGTGRAAEPKVWPVYFDNRDGAWADSFSGEKIAYPQVLEEPLQRGGTFGGLVALLEALCPEMAVTQANWTRLDAYLTDIDAVSADKLAPAHIQPHTV